MGLCFLWSANGVQQSNSKVISFTFTGLNLKANTLCVQAFFRKTWISFQTGLRVIWSKDYKLLPSSSRKNCRPPVPADRKWPSQAAENSQYSLPAQIDKSCFHFNFSFWSLQRTQCHLLTGKPSKSQGIRKDRHFRNNPIREALQVQKSVIQESQISVKNTPATSEADFGYLRWDRTQQKNTGQEPEARNKGYILYLAEIRATQQWYQLRLKHSWLTGLKELPFTNCS